ncbi:single-stranded DNA-binding protein [Phenylobacterium terrae]|uniref:Single-stranded DNA-binding protein n=1 Tax=Phenylobacterium terrae TaxID=2665495 RepID=A0ABW4N5V9_9CAUL
MQNVIVDGYLAADPEILTAERSGARRARFRVVETTRFRRADGEAGERTTGFNCLCFDEAVAERYLGAYARKGSRVVVQGHVENDTWTGRDGAVHYDLRLIVREVRIKDRRGEAPAPAGRRP